MRATIHSIAKELNISASTVSRALSDHPSISEKTKKFVREAAERAGYRMNNVASALRLGRTKTIGVIVPTADRSFLASVVSGIEEVANSAGYHVMICQSNDNYQAELKNIAALLQAQVDGILMAIAKGTTDYEHFKQLHAQGVPLILFDRVTFNAGVSTVTIDDYDSAYRATKHLIEQGCTRIATMAGIQTHLNIYEERMRGYCDALKDHGHSYREEYVVSCDLNIENGKAGAARLWTLPQVPDGIFCMSDYAALGVIQYLKAKGVRIPKEVAVAGFVNEPFATYIEPALTTIDQHPVEMGRVTAKLFLEQIETNKAAFRPKNIILNANLIIRESSLLGQ